MKELNSITEERKWLLRLYSGYMLFVILIEGYRQHLIHQLSEPVLISPGADNVYWLLHLLGVPPLIAGSEAVAIGFESVLAVILIGCIVWPAKTILPVFFSVMFLIFMITKNSYVAHHEHGLVVPFMMSIVFWSKREERFSFLFRSLRYYVLFVFVSAACWKIFRGSAFHPDQLSEILKQQHLYFFSKNTDGFRYDALLYLVNHRAVGMLVHSAAVILQLSFIVGFFTRKFDTALLCLFFVFFLGNWFLMGLSFYQMWIACVVFFPLISLRVSEVELNDTPAFTSK